MQIADTTQAIVDLRERMQEAIAETCGGTALEPVPKWLRSDLRTAKARYTKLALDQAALAAIEVCRCIAALAFAGIASYFLLNCPRSVDP